MPEPDEATRMLDTLRALLRGHTDRGDERAILRLLGEAPAAVLDRVLETIDLTELVSAVDDRLFGPDHRTALLGLLCRDRLRELGVASRAALVRALQRGRTGSLPERYIRDVLVGTSGRDLPALKAALDAGPDYHDLHQLLFHDVDDEALRAEILAHFAAEAARSRSAALRVLSDVDDTFYANWKDTRYPKKTVYPGVRAFYEALGGQVVFVTARPADRAGLVEDGTLEMLRRRGMASATVLGGSLSHLLGNHRIAAKKLQNVREYKRLYPEHALVLVGDSGQGDVALGERLLEDPSLGTRAVFIHDVVGMPEDERAERRAANIHFFDTYAGAAAAARDLGLLDDAAARRVADAAAAEMEAVAFADDAQRAARRGELDRDRQRLLSA